MNKTRGALLVLTAAVCFGVMPLLAHGAYVEGEDVPTLLFQRFGIASVFLWILILVKKEPLPSGKPLLMLALMGGVAYFGQAFTYFEALRFLPAGLASLLAFTYPIIVSVASHFFFHERLTRARVGALLIAVVGMGLSIGPVGAGSALGIFLALLSAVGAAAYLLMGARAPENVSPLVTNAVVLGSAALSFLTLALVHGFSPVDMLALEWGTALSMASLIAIACLLRGLKDIGAVNASILLAVEPITAGVLGHFVLDQSLDVLQIAGGVLIILGVIILIRSKAAEKGAEPAMA